MSTKANENLVTKFACFLGIVQGLAYAAMSLACVIIYNNSPKSVFNIESYMDLIVTNMYVFYLGRDIPNFEDQIFHPSTFAVFMWVYFIFHLIWIGTSIEMCYKKVFIRDKSLKFWSYVTFVVSSWDLITVIILGIDYNRCLIFMSRSPFTNFKDMVFKESGCANGILTVLIIAARGFTLWFINVTLAVTIYKLSRKQKNAPVTSSANLRVRSQTHHLHSIQNEAPPPYDFRNMSENML